MSENRRGVSGSMINCFSLRRLLFYAAFASCIPASLASCVSLRLIELILNCHDVTRFLSTALSLVSQYYFLSLFCTFIPSTKIALPFLLNRPFLDSRALHPPHPSTKHELISSRLLKTRSRFTLKCRSFGVIDMLALHPSE